MMYAFLNISTGEIPIPPQENKFPSWQILHFTGVNKGFEFGQCGDTTWHIVEAFERNLGGVSESEYTERNWRAPVAENGVVYHDYTVEYLPIENIRAMRWEDTKRIRNRSDGVTLHNGNWFASDDSSKALLDGAIASDQPARFAGLGQTFAWLTVDNIAVPMATAADLVALRDAGANRIADNFRNSQMIRAQINAAATVTDVLAIDINAGWAQPYEPSP